MRLHGSGKAPAVSVVVPLCGVASGAGATCLSVLDQDVEAVELVAVDDGSTPGLADVLRRWLGTRIRILETPGTGAAAARAAGFAACQGSLVTCVAPGMVMAPGWLREARARFLNEPRIDLVLGWRYLYDGRRGLLKAAVPKSFVRDPAKHFRRDPSLSLADFVVRRDWWNSSNLADEGDEVASVGTLLRAATVLALDHPTVWTPHLARRRAAAILSAERIRQALLPRRRAA